MSNGAKQENAQDAKMLSFVEVKYHEPKEPIEKLVLKPRQATTSVPNPPPSGPPSRSSRSKIEEMKHIIAKLKTDLENERIRSRQIYRDKFTEISKVKEDSNRVKELAIKDLEKKFSIEKAIEVQKVKENIIKEKDNENRRLVKEKEDEIRRLKSSLVSERERAVNAAIQIQKKSLREQHNAILNRYKILQDEVDSLKRDKIVLSERLTEKEREILKVNPLTSTPRSGTYNLDGEEDTIKKAIIPRLKIFISREDSLLWFA
ncbi:DgyrCDS9624 [Dimorphilus gyrociliatus]|uniref:DgyrCDS9624 n=1 Tax=Dimorphilus gyrociliatus TaxID=2664684 RepID=A0A7I8VXX7_9ANNE|nr:DgyrCDS9624 [Dimorphilus gyrociliatus]